MKAKEKLEEKKVEKQIKTVAKTDRVFVCLILILAVLIVNTGLLIWHSAENHNNSNKSNSENKNEEENQDYDVSTFKEIKGTELANNTQGENKVVYIGRSTCSWCVKFVPVLKELQEKYDIEILYIDISKIIDFNSNSIIDQASHDAIVDMPTVSGMEEYHKNEFGATPMTIIVKDGKLVDGFTGYAELSTFVNLLEQNGFK